MNGAKKICQKNIKIKIDKLKKLKNGPIWLPLEQTQKWQPEMFINSEKRIQKHFRKELTKRIALAMLEIS